MLLTTLKPVPQLNQVLHGSKRTFFTTLATNSSFLFVGTNTASVYSFTLSSYTSCGVASHSTLRGSISHMYVSENYLAVITTHRDFITVFSISEEGNLKFSFSIKTLAAVGFILFQDNLFFYSIGTEIFISKISRNIHNHVTSLIVGNHVIQMDFYPPTNTLLVTTEPIAKSNDRVMSTSPAQNHDTLMVRIDFEAPSLSVIPITFKIKTNFDAKNSGCQVLSKEGPLLRSFVSKGNSLWIINDKGKSKQINFNYDVALKTETNSTDSIVKGNDCLSSTQSIVIGKLHCFGDRFVISHSIFGILIFDPFSASVLVNFLNFNCSAFSIFPNYNSCFLLNSESHEIAVLRSQTNSELITSSLKFLNQNLPVEAGEILVDLGPDFLSDQSNLIDRILKMIDSSTELYQRLVDLLQSISIKLNLNLLEKHDVDAFIPVITSSIIFDCPPDSSVISSESVSDSFNELTLINDIQSISIDSRQRSRKARKVAISLAETTPSIDWRQTIKKDEKSQRNSLDSVDSVVSFEKDFDSSSTISLEIVKENDQIISEIQVESEKKELKLVEDQTKMIDDVIPEILQTECVLLENKVEKIIEENLVQLLAEKLQSLEKSGVTNNLIDTMEIIFDLISTVEISQLNFFPLLNHFLIVHDSSKLNSKICELLSVVGKFVFKISFLTDFKSSSVSDCQSFLISSELFSTYFDPFFVFDLLLSLEDSRLTSFLDSILSSKIHNSFIDQFLSSLFELFPLSNRLDLSFFSNFQIFVSKFLFNYSHPLLKSLLLRHLIILDVYNSFSDLSFISPVKNSVLFLNVPIFLLKLLIPNQILIDLIGEVVRLPDYDCFGWLTCNFLTEYWAHLFSQLNFSPNISFSFENLRLFKPKDVPIAFSDSLIKPFLIYFNSNLNFLNDVFTYLLESNFVSELFCLLKAVESQLLTFIPQSIISFLTYQSFFDCDVELFYFISQMCFSDIICLSLLVKIAIQFHSENLRDSILRIIEIFGWKFTVNNLSQNLLLSDPQISEIFKLYILKTLNK
ncbi:hypothetical protein RCL1_000885 [Eukaryota sp. TZLM3-RCL]